MTLIIAEAGVNHNGDMKIAHELIKKASEAGADIVKFQTFSAESLATKYASKADYQNQTTDKNQSQREMLKNLELKSDQHLELIEICKKFGVEFLSTGFDKKSIEFLNKLSLKRFKIPSGEITNLPYLKQIGSFGKPIILSSGMANIGEIEAAINILEKAGTFRKNISILHCTSEYPAPYSEVNLKAIETISKTFNVKVGYSDHTLGIEVPIAAVALGAVIIEKHLTLDKKLPGPDHKASLEPDAFKDMVRGIRIIEKSLGNGIKEPSLSEIPNKEIIRKSIVAAENIEKGEKFSEINLTTKRPATGISPMRWEEIIGKESNKSYKIDDLIE